MRSTTSRQTSPTDSPSSKSTPMGLMLSLHQQQQDHMMNPLEIQSEWTSSVEMAPSQLP
jgi:hypothetical protein